MDKSVFLDAHVQEKRMHSLLTEVLDLTMQMADAADRGDEITIQLLLGMRADPLENLKQVRLSLEQLRDSLSPEEGRYLAAILNGGPAQQPKEKPLANQVEINRKLFRQVLSCDQRLNQKVTRDNSIYKNRPSADMGVEQENPSGLSFRA